MLGRAPAELLAKPELFLESVHAQDRAQFATQAQQAIATGTRIDYEMRMTDTGGQERWLKMTATPGTEARTDGRTHFSGFLFDVTEARLQQAKLHDMAYRDPLTHAKNRRSFVDALELELARIRRFGGEAALIMLDIDFFKHVNDTHGHDVGDAVLEHLVGVLQGALRSVDALGRLGGEEFAVLLPETSVASATLLAERLRVAVAHSPAVVGALTVPFTISLGVALMDASTTDVKVALKRADSAMYRAKQTGRNRVCSEV